MSTDDRDVLEVLKAELNFIEKGGYGKPAGEPWVSSSLFQDSPSCLNVGDPTRSHPCRECLLIDFVPPEDRGQVVPCHHIPLTPTGETAYSIEASQNQQRLEEGVKNWLRDTIKRIEQERPSDKTGGLTALSLGLGKRPNHLEETDIAAMKEGFERAESGLSPRARDKYLRLAGELEDSWVV